MKQQKEHTDYAVHVLAQPFLYHAVNKFYCYLSDIVSSFAMAGFFHSYGAFVFLFKKKKEKILAYFQEHRNNKQILFNVIIVRIYLSVHYNKLHNVMQS